MVGYIESYGLVFKLSQDDPFKTQIFPRLPLILKQSISSIVYSFANVNLYPSIIFPLAQCTVMVPILFLKYNK